MNTLVAPLSPPSPHPLLAGFHAQWRTVFFVAAISLGFSAVLWIDDPRPFWHPLVTCLIYGFCIAYCVNVAAPWYKRRAVLRILVAVIVGATLGVALVIVVKQYSMAYVREHASTFGWNLFSAALNGFVCSLIFHLKFREVHVEAELLKAHAERNLLSRQAVEAELALMQAQVEPHFLFNTLASVQYLTETDPPRANRLLGHLIDYLRAAVPQLRASSSTLGKEADLAQAYLSILQMRMGERLAFVIHLPATLRNHPFPPNMLISLVENSVKHGLEPAVAGGTITVDAALQGDSVVVRIADTGTGVAVAERPASGHGVGLANIRERLSALYGERGRFTLAQGPGGGAVAMLAIPYMANA